MTTTSTAASAADAKSKPTPTAMPPFEPERARIPLVVGVWAMPGGGDEAIAELDRVARSLEDEDLELLFLANEEGAAVARDVAARMAERGRRGAVAVVDVAAGGGVDATEATNDNAAVRRLSFPAAPGGLDAATARQVRLGAAACFIALRSSVRVLFGAPGTPPPAATPDDLDTLAALDSPVGQAAFFAACAERGRLAVTESLAPPFYRFAEPWRPARRRLDPPERGCNVWKTPSPTSDAHLAAMLRDLVSYNSTIATEGCATWVERLLAWFGPRIVPSKAAANLFAIAGAGAGAGVGAGTTAGAASPTPAPNLLAAYLAANTMTKRLEGIRDRAMAVIYGGRGPRTQRPYLLPLSRLLFAMASFSFVAVLVFAAYSKLYKAHAAQTFFLSVYIMLLVLVSLLMSWLMRADLKRRSEDLRALREGLRVQMMWRLAGVDGFAADHYPRILKEDVAWIRVALGGAALRALIESGASSTAPRDHALVARAWLEDQARFYGTSHHGGGSEGAEGIEPGASHLAPRQGKMARSSQAVLDAETRHGLALGLVVGAALLTLIHLGVESGLALVTGHTATTVATPAGVPHQQSPHDAAGAGEAATHDAQTSLGGGMFELTSTALITAILVLALWARRLYLSLPTPGGDRRAGGKGHARKKHWDPVALRALALGLTAAILLGVVGVATGLLLPENAYLKTGGKSATSWWVTAITVAALLAGLIHSRLHFDNDVNDAHAFEAAGAIYREACRAHASLMSGVPTGAVPSPELEAARLKLLKELGRQALAESGRWLLQRRERDLELPHTV